MILIKIKKFKKFEINQYEFYEVIRNENLNIYVFKSLEVFQTNISLTKTK